jgi:hypothetical protein
MELTRAELLDLHEKMAEHFDANGLRMLCFKLGVDYEDLGGENKTAKILSLIEWHKHRSTLLALLDWCTRERPEVDWPRPKKPDADSQPAGPGPKASKIVILFLAANPEGTDALRLGQEVRTIDERLRLARFRDRFELVQAHAVRVRDIGDALLRYQPHVVHFSGHGSADGNLIFEDETGEPKPVSPKALGATFQALKDNVRCVVLNACWSNQQASAVAKEIDCVVGMSRAISDEAAIDFAAGFYQALGYGRSVQVAFDLGRAQVGLEGLPEAATPRLRTKEGVDAGQVVLV